ncbi:optic atrophy 3 protein homolog [Tribolium castaneum]|uniref:OPA3-like protein CG13603 n=1 Tax=Tribolium castaneum TaxID=7070 RepID=D6WR52_TRICA|nr:PREDICTED: optic atrophy 3 protein homolog [Tribolium castaneum]EFA07648.2 Putative OPA3-like protein CG13603 [Tribolium castaneum]|eukprot:XP_008195927.1 PREDICTED: optic atrophy 3 protein homolog [Tribolium castaneum]
MVIHAFPAAKLGALLIKQISKPIANAVKQGAKSSPVFRKYVCLPPAQFYNWCERKAKMWLLHLGQPVNITVLNEAASIELGANLLGETVIFIIAAGVLLAEYNRSSKKEAAKEEARKLEMRELQTALRDLFIQTEEQGAYIRELTRKVGELETRVGYKTTPPKNSPPKEPPSQDPPQYKPSNENIVLAPEKLANLDLTESHKHKPLKGVIFRAISDVENNFFFDPNSEREEGIISVALNHIYKNVYRSHLTF